MQLLRGDVPPATVGHKVEYALFDQFIESSVPDVGDLQGLLNWNEGWNLVRLNKLFVAQCIVHWGSPLLFVAVHPQQSDISGEQID